MFIIQQQIYNIIIYKKLVLIENTKNNFRSPLKGFIDKQKIKQQNTYQNEDGNTKAMLQALKGKIPDEDLIHNPEIVNKKNQTVALILSKQGIIPPKCWNHDPNIRDTNLYTVEMYLQYNKLPIPNNWITNKNKLYIMKRLIIKIQDLINKILMDLLLQ